MIDRWLWLPILLCGLIGASIGGAGSGLGWPKLGAWLAITLLTYVLALGLIFVQGLTWMHSVVQTTGEPAAISFDLVQEFVRMDLTLIIAALAYFVSLGAPPDWVNSGRLPFALSGAVCGMAAIAVRRLRPRSFSTTHSVS